MKRLITMLIAVVMIAALAACGTTAAAPQAGTADAAPAGAADAGEKVIMKLGHGNGSSDTDMINMYANEFKRLVEEYTEGQIEVQVYPSSQLGDEAEMYGAVGLGSLECTLGAATNYCAYAPLMNFTVLPYVFDDLASCRKFFTENVDWMNEYCIPQANSRVLGLAVGGMRSLASDRPITCLDDVKGMKVRVPGTKPMVEFWTAVGASPQVVAWAETYTALEQGVANGVCGNEWILIDNKFGEVCGYFVYVDYMPQPNALVMSEAFYQTLTPEQQDAVKRAGAEATQFFMELADQRKAEYRKMAEDQNGVIFMDAPTDIEEWKTLGRSTWDKAYADIGNGDAAAGAEIMDYIVNYSK